MPSHTWKKTKGWHNHSVGCWDAQWTSYKEAAAMSNAKSTNAWITSWLDEAVKYERLRQRELLADERGDGFA
jgi:hypothetical protein